MRAQVVYMRYIVRFSRESPAFAMVLVVAVIVLALSVIPKSEFEDSTGWRLGVYYLAMFLLLLLTFIVGFHRPPGLGTGYMRAVLVLAGLTPVVVFTLGWALGGGYSDLRDPRIFRMTVISVLSFLSLWMAVAFPYSFYLLGRIVFRHWRGSGADGAVISRGLGALSG